MRIIFTRIIPALLVTLIFALAALEYRQQSGTRRAAEAFAGFEVEPVTDLGSTRILRILPLLEYHSADPDLETVVGVSYLVDTDEHRILYDVGQNPEGKSPSPLQGNMGKLGIELESIDTVFISHNHLDHVGGLRWQNEKTFSLGTEQLPFPNPGTVLVMPEPMSYPGLSGIHADRPMRIGEGVGSTGLASTGAIGRQLALGWIEEHSLVVNVEGLGGIIIVACGHQSVPRLVQRYEDAFEAPLYGVIGGLHFPVPEGRLFIGPVDAQRRFASGDGLLRPLQMDEVDNYIDLLRERDLGIIAISAHDSSDEAIERVRRAFGDAHRYIRVGEEIRISASSE